MSGLEKNVSGQKWLVRAFDLDGLPVTGGAANITAKIRKDFGSATALGDTNPTELESGFYEFDLTQAETNAKVLDLIAVSATVGVYVVGVPARIFTVPAGSATAAVQTVVQTGDAYARLGPPAGASIAADIATRLASASYTAPPSAASNASAVRTELTTELGRIDASISSRSSHTAAGAATAVRTELTTELGRIDAAVSSRLASGSYTAPPSAASNASAVRTELATELGRIDAATSTRLASADYTEPPTAIQIRTEIDDNSDQLQAALSAIAALPADLRTELAVELGRIDAAVSSRLASGSYTAPPSAATNASAVRTELATELARIDASVSSRSSHTAANAATAVRTELGTELGRIDAAVSSRLATSGYTAPPSAASNATAVRTELGTELGRIDTAVSSRSSHSAADVSAAVTLAHGSGSYTTATGFATPANVTDAKDEILTAVGEIEGGGPGSGSGTEQVVVTVLNENDEEVPNARVVAKSAGVPRASGLTGALGATEALNVDVGVYVLDVDADGYEMETEADVPGNRTLEVESGTVAKTVKLKLRVIPSSVEPDTLTLVIYVLQRNDAGDGFEPAGAGHVVRAQITDSDQDGLGVINPVLTATTGADSRAYFTNFPTSSRYKAWIDGATTLKKSDITADAGDSHELPFIVGSS